ncbi:hypothetical protein L2E82_46990 [Cichorium intybus]|uniref:Uncharacterized protein n=1 Tax=Cichorium intybus TaxID=13427 RepID=A0ACB8YU52_CICIN|nr:hypothetical protein L2E82_46990 [Cichorium intybus]
MKEIGHVVYVDSNWEVPFSTGKRDFLGLDGAFMKGPFPGQILTAVALDGNNGVYPLAYAIVEAENLDSWTWFLTNLGDDLGLTSNSNFTFITDRQKGVLPAIAKSQFKDLQRAKSNW